MRMPRRRYLEQLVVKTQNARYTVEMKAHHEKRQMVEVRIM
jgi:hypothetical protein